MDELAEYFEALGLSATQWNVGPEHPRLEEYALGVLAGTATPRVLEVGFQSGGFAVPIILALHDRPGFQYVGIDSLAYRNAVHGDLIAAYLSNRGVSRGYEFRVGEAGRLLRTMIDPPFDLVLIDHYKPLYARDFHAIARRGLVCPGGVVLFHDVLGRARRAWQHCLPVCHAYGYTGQVTDEVPGGLAIARRQKDARPSITGSLRRRVVASVVAGRELRRRLTAALQAGRA